jgi:hypothetical protein
LECKEEHQEEHQEAAAEDLVAEEEEAEVALIEAPHNKSNQLLHINKLWKDLCAVKSLIKMSPF